jgi:PAS domain S-box-containing protein
MLAEAERLAGVGSFDRDILTGKLHRSDGFLCIFGVKRQDMSSSPDGFLAYIHEDDRERIRDSMVKCVTEGTPLREESCVCRPDGTQRIIHAEGKVTKDAAGRPIRFLGWIQDITERKQAEEALLRSKSSLNRAELLAGMGSFDCDIAADRVIRSDGIYSLFGASLEEMGDRPEGFLKQVHPEDRTWVRRSLLKSLREGSPFQDEYRIIRGDGIQRTVHAEGEVSKDAQGRPLRFFGWLQDITERRALEEKVLQISDRERRSIGHDLHDDLGQQLTGITLLGKALQERLAAQASPEAGAMAELLKHVDNALARVREMSRSLESVPPRPEGLFEALSGLAAHVSSTARISCQLKAGRHIMVESQNVANHLYRIAQEAVHNAVRHGGPKAITISLAQRDEGLTLTVADDGAGLLDASKKASGMGLDIMRHRANIIHGTLTISSHAGGGTEVICRVPAGTPDDGGGE